LLTDERGVTAAAFLRRAPRWFRARGVHVRRVRRHTGRQANRESEQGNRDGIMRMSTAVLLPRDRRPRASFGRYLEVLAEQERGINIRPNHVPSTFLFAFALGRIVGRVSIRHSLNAFLARVGGHIGYVVVPKFRRRGYATMMLRLALKIAKEKLGIGRVLVTCDDDNIASIRTIEKCGGVLENIITGLGLEIPKRRYWIEAG
jgi:predicted acetyltransferase